MLRLVINPRIRLGKTLKFVFFCFFFMFFFYRSSSALHCRSSTEILPHNWGTFCAGVCPMCVFSFLVAAGFEPTYFSLGSRHFNHYHYPKLIINPSIRVGITLRLVSNPEIRLGITVSLVINPIIRQGYISL